jgi:hypothetical protein
MKSEKHGGCHSLNCRSCDFGGKTNWASLFSHVSRWTFAYALANNSTTQSEDNRMGMLTTLRQPQWAAPISAGAVCGLVWELMPENRAEASVPLQVKANQPETAHNHTHNEPATPHHIEVNTTAARLSTTPAPDSGGSWDWNPNTVRFERCAPSPHAGNPESKATARVVAPLVMV